jgi:hypothetical protein
MRTTDVDILIVPGWTNSGPDHWQTRWEQRLKTVTRVQMPDFNRPVRTKWVAAIRATVEQATRPVVLVGHSCGVAAIAHAAAELDPKRVIGGFLVAPVDLEMPAPFEDFARTEPAGSVELPSGFDPLPIEPFPFPSLLIASRNDPFCSFDAAGQMALAWGSELLDAGEAGHLNVASGHGPWPEGALRFGGFLRQLSAARDRPLFG